MKKEFVGSFQPGQTIDDIFVLVEKYQSQKRDGNPFLNVVLCDKTGQIKGVAWDNVEGIASSVSPGDFVAVKASVSEYKGSLQLVIRSMKPCPEDTVDPSDFIAETPLDVENLFDRLKNWTDTLANEHIRKLFEAFWQDETFVADFKRAPAAKMMHHAYLGGLLVHTLSMMGLADKIARHYKGVDRDLLLTGAFLHDIGKVRELEYRYKIDYSDEGRLLSHIVIGMSMIDEKIRTIHDFPKELAMLIRHLVVSHHGSQEYGSPEPPKTIEAVILNYIDEIDSKVNGIRDFMASEDSSQTWTSYHKILGRHFYMGPLHRAK
jgi:3'-5' exoribonuclease